MKCFTSNHIQAPLREVFVGFSFCFFFGAPPELPQRQFQPPITAVSLPPQPSYELEMEGKRQA